MSEGPPPTGRTGHGGREDTPRCSGVLPHYNTTSLPRYTALLGVLVCYYSGALGGWCAQSLPYATVRYGPNPLNETLTKV